MYLGDSSPVADYGGMIQAHAALPTHRRSLWGALLLEIAPVLAPVLAISALVGLLLLDPPLVVAQVLVTPLFFACFLFFLSGMGWLYAGEQRIGIALMIGRGVAAMALASFSFRALGEIDCGRSCAGPTDVAIIPLLFVAVGVPIVSTIMLGVAMVAQRWRVDG